MTSKTLKKAVSLLLAFVMLLSLMGSVTLANTNNGWTLVEGGNLAFYQNGVRVGQGSGPNGHFALALQTQYGTADFFFTNEGHLVRGLVSYGGAWHYFDSTHGTRLLSGAAVTGWWNWGLAPGQLRFLYADGTRAENELVTITWDCNYGGPSEAVYLFDTNGLLVTEFDFDLGDGLSVHSAFGEWHVMATHSFNRVANFNVANGGGWIQPRPGVLRYLVADGTYVTGPATVENGRVNVPANEFEDAFSNVPGIEGVFHCPAHPACICDPADPADDCFYFDLDFLFCEDGYLQFGWVYVNDIRVAYIGANGVRVVGEHTTSDDYEIDFGPPGAPSSDWEFIDPQPDYNLRLSATPSGVTLENGETQTISLTTYRSQYTGALVITAVPDWIGGPRTITPGGLSFTHNIDVTVPAYAALTGGVDPHQIIFTVTPLNPERWTSRYSLPFGVHVVGDGPNVSNLYLSASGPPATIAPDEPQIVRFLVGHDGYTGPLTITASPAWMLAPVTITRDGSDFSDAVVEILVPSTVLVEDNPHTITFTVAAVNSASLVTPATYDLVFDVDFIGYDYSLFALSVAPTPLTIEQNSQEMITFTIDRGPDYTGPVAITHTTTFLPSPIIIPAGSDSVSANLFLPWNVPVGPATIIFTARGAAATPVVASVMTTLTLNVEPATDDPGDLGLSLRPLPAIPNNPPASRNETFPVLFSITRGGYDGELRLTANPDWIGGPIIIPAGATNSGLVDITVAANAMPPAQAMTFTLEPVDSNANVRPASETFAIPIASRLLQIAFPEDDWPQWEAWRHVADEATFINVYLPALHSSLPLYTNPPGFIAPSTSGALVWEFFSQDNSGRPFNNSAEHTNYFRWTLVLPPGVANPDNIPLTGLFAVTNYAYDLFEVPLDPAGRAHFSGWGDRSLQPAIHLDRLVRNSAEAVARLNSSSATQPALFDNSGARTPAHTIFVDTKNRDGDLFTRSHPARVTWSFNPVYNGGAFDPSSGAQNVMVWTITRSPNVNTPRWFPNGFRALNMASPDTPTNPTMSSGIPLTGTIVVTNVVAYLTADFTLTLPATLSNLPGVTQYVEGPQMFLNNRSRPDEIFAGTGPGESPCATFRIHVSANVNTAALPLHAQSVNPLDPPFDRPSPADPWTRVPIGPAPLGWDPADHPGPGANEPPRPTDTRPYFGGLYRVEWLHASSSRGWGIFDNRSSSVAHPVGRNYFRWEVQGLHPGIDPNGHLTHGLIEITNYAVWSTGVTQFETVPDLPFMNVPTHNNADSFLNGDRFSTWQAYIAIPADTTVNTTNAGVTPSVGTIGTPQTQTRANPRNRTLGWSFVNWTGAFTVPQLYQHIGQDRFAIYVDGHQAGTMVVEPGHFNEPGITPGEVIGPIPFLPNDIPFSAHGAEWVAGHQDGDGPLVPDHAIRDRDITFITSQEVTGQPLNGFTNGLENTARNTHTFTWYIPQTRRALPPWMAYGPNGEWLHWGSQGTNNVLRPTLPPTGLPAGPWNPPWVTIPRWPVAIPANNWHAAGDFTFDVWPDTNQVTRRTLPQQQTSPGGGSRSRSVVGTGWNGFNYTGGAWSGWTVPDATWNSWNPWTPPGYNFIRRHHGGTFINAPSSSPFSPLSLLLFGEEMLSEEYDYFDVFDFWTE